MFDRKNWTRLSVVASTLLGALTASQLPELWLWLTVDESQASQQVETPLLANALPSSMDSSVRYRSDINAVKQDKVARERAEAIPAQQKSDEQLAVASNSDSSTAKAQKALLAWPTQLRELAARSFDLDELTTELVRHGFEVKKEQKGNPISGLRLELSATNIYGETVFSQYFVNDEGLSSFDSISLKSGATPENFANLIEQSEEQFELDPAMRKGKSLAAVYGIQGNSKTLSLIFDQSSSAVTVTIENTECENAL